MKEKKRMFVWGYPGIREDAPFVTSIHQTEDGEIYLTEDFFNKEGELFSNLLFTQDISESTYEDCVETFTEIIKATTKTCHEITEFRYVEPKPGTSEARRQAELIRIYRTKAQA